MILPFAFDALTHAPTAPPLTPNANVVLANAIADDCPSIKSHDGSDFDWGLELGNADVKRCLLDLAQNLETVKAMADWMRAQRFRVSKPCVTSSGTIYLDATWDNINIFSRVLIVKNKPFTRQVTHKNDIPHSAHAEFLIK